MKRKYKPTLLRRSLDFPTHTDWMEQRFSYVIVLHIAHFVIIIIYSEAGGGPEIIGVAYPT